MESKSAQIRDLGRQGVPTAEIARQLGISYQFAYGVLSKARPSSPNAESLQQARLLTEALKKPQLTTARLIAAGFEHSATWCMSGDGQLSLDRKLGKQAGVYAFVIDGEAVYVGLASMGLAARIYFYGRPGVSQRTSLRLNGRLKVNCAEGIKVEVYTVSPPDLKWMGLPVDGCAGLELGLIRNFALPWNVRSAG